MYICMNMTIKKWSVIAWNAPVQITKISKNMKSDKKEVNPAITNETKS